MGILPDHLCGLGYLLLHLVKGPAGLAGLHNDLGCTVFDPHGLGLTGAVSSAGVPGHAGHCCGCAMAQCQKPNNQTDLGRVDDRCAGLCGDCRVLLSGREPCHRGQLCGLLLLAPICSWLWSRRRRMCAHTDQEICIERLTSACFCLVAVLAFSEPGPESRRNGYHGL